MSRLQLKILSFPPNCMMRVFSEDGRRILADIPLTDYTMKNSADGTAELNITIKGFFREAEMSTSLTEVSLLDR